MHTSGQWKTEFLSRPVLWICIGFNADPEPAFNLNADPDLGRQTNAEPDTNQIFTPQMLNFLMKNILLYVGNES
jgi:hypothetical protein